MNHILDKFWLGLTFIAIAFLLLIGKVASGQTAPPASGDTVVLSGFLSCNSSNAGPQFCPFRLHYVTLIEGRGYTIHMESSEFDSQLALENLEGVLLASSEDCWDTLNGMIVFRPASTGGYRLIASNAAPVEGFYTITLREIPVVLNVEAVLTPSDVSAHDAFERVYEVALAAGKRYVIDLESREFEGVVKVMNRHGVVVAFADECDAMRSARIVFTPTETGLYRIAATTYSAGATGTFRLTVCDAGRYGELLAGRR